MRTEKKPRRFILIILFSFFYLTVGYTIFPTAPVYAAQGVYEQSTRDNLAKTKQALAPQNNETVPSEKQLSKGLSGYIAYAMAQSHSLRAAFEQWQSKVYQISKARKLPEPTISYGYFLLNVETRLGPQRHRLSLKQSFPWPTKLTRGADAASAKARSFEQKFEAASLAVQSRVAAAYWRLWLIRQTISIQESLVGIAKESLKAVQARVVTGGASLAEQQQMDLFIARLEDAIEGLKLTEKVAAANLLAAISAPQGIVTPTQDAPPPLVQLAESEIELSKAAKSHPLIASFESSAEGSDFLAQSMDAARFPSLTLGVDWIEVGDIDMADVPNSGRDALILGVGVKLPIWQKYYKDAINASKAEANALRAKGQSVYSDKLAALSNAYATIKDTYRRAELNQGTLIIQAEAVLDSVIGAYMTGRTSVSAIILAQRDLVELKIALVKAQAEHAIALSNLEQLIGRQAKIKIEK